MNGEEARQELQKLAELRHKLLEAYDPLQEIGPPRGCYELD
jgi:flagellar hook-basal body complex protein FliE